MSMKRIMVSLFAVTAVLCLIGCDTAAAPTSPGKSQTSVQLLETQFDIFNLRWGCSREFVEKNCDFGGKPVKKLADSYYKLEFSKGSVFTRFSYTKDGKLYNVTMIRYFHVKDFAEAIDFFFYMNSLLRKKYPDENNPKFQYNRHSLSGYFKYMHLPTAVKWEHFMLSNFDLLVEYETKTTRIGLSVTPWSRPNSLDTIPVFLLTYSSKQILPTSKVRNDSAGSDSRGL